MALPVTPCQWVGQWLIVSDFGDSYRIYRACELVFNVIFNVHLFYFFERRVARSSWSEGRHGSLLTSVTQHIHNTIQKCVCIVTQHIHTVAVLQCYTVTVLHSTFTGAIDPTLIVLYNLIKGNTQFTVVVTLSIRFLFWNIQTIVKYTYTVMIPEVTVPPPPPPLLAHFNTIQHLIKLPHRWLLQI